MWVSGTLTWGEFDGGVMSYTNEDRARMLDVGGQVRSAGHGPGCSGTKDGRDGGRDARGASRREFLQVVVPGRPK